MRNEFRSFAEMLATPQDDDVSVVPIVEPVRQSSADEIELMRDVRLFRARIAESVDNAVETILADIAADVLARELRLAPADIGSIINRALERFLDEHPLRVRVHSDDAARVKCAVPVVADDSLLPGDAILELQSGSVDASLGIRLAAVLRGVTG